MRFCDEAAYPCSIRRSEGEQAALLVARFGDRAVSLSLSWSVEGQAYGSTFSDETFSECLRGILLESGGASTVLSLSHSVLLASSDASPTLKTAVILDEEIRLAAPHLEEVLYRYRLRSEPSTASVEDHFSQTGIYDLFSKGRRIVACATCAYANMPSYGGEDDRHGLYCLRRHKERLPTLRYEDWEVWRALSYTHVNAFHACEEHAFRSRPV